MTGEGEEDVVKARPLHAEVVDLDARAVEGAAVIVSALPTAAPSDTGTDLPTALEALVAAARSTGAAACDPAGAKADVRTVSTFFASRERTVWIALPA